MFGVDAGNLGWDNGEREFGGVPLDAPAWEANPSLYPILSLPWSAFLDARDAAAFTLDNSGYVRGWKSETAGARVDAATGAPYYWAVYSKGEGAGSGNPTRTTTSGPPNGDAFVFFDGTSSLISGTHYSGGLSLADCGAYFFIGYYANTAGVLGDQGLWIQAAPGKWQYVPASFGWTGYWDFSDWNGTTVPGRVSGGTSGPAVALTDTTAFVTTGGGVNGHGSVSFTPGGHLTGDALSAYLPNPALPWLIACVFKIATAFPDPGVGARHVAPCLLIDSAGYYFTLAVHDGGVTLQISDTAVVGSITTQAPSVGDWHVVLVGFDGTTYSIQLDNGTLVTMGPSDVGAAPASASPIFVGASWDGGNALDGEIASLEIGPDTNLIQALYGRARELQDKYRAATFGFPGSFYMQTATNVPVMAGGIASADGVNDYLDSDLTLADVFAADGSKGSATFAVDVFGPPAYNAGTLTAQTPYANPALLADASGYFAVGVVAGYAYVGAYDGVNRDVGGGPNDGWQVAKAAAPGSAVPIVVQIRWDATIGLLEIRVNLGAWVSCAFSAIAVMSGKLRLFSDYAISYFQNAYIYEWSTMTRRMTDGEADDAVREQQARIQGDYGAPALVYAGGALFDSDVDTTTWGFVNFMVARSDAPGATGGIGAWNTQPGLWGTDGGYVEMVATTIGGVPKYQLSLLDGVTGEFYATASSGASAWHMVTTQLEDRYAKVRIDGALSSEGTSDRLQGNPIISANNIYFGRTVGGQFTGGIAFSAWAPTNGWEPARIRDVERWITAAFMTVTVVPITGSGGAALSHFTISGTGTVTFSGSAAISLQRFSVAALGGESFNGSGAVALNPYAASATGSETFTGTCAIAVQKYATASTGAESFSGTCAITLQSLAVSGAGAQSFTGTCAIAVQRLAVAASGAESFAGTCAINLSPFTTSSAGAETFTGSAAIAVQRLAVAGTAAETFSGTCAITLASYACSGAGTYTPQAITGTCAISLASLTLAGAGLESFAGTCAIALHPFTLAGTGTYTPQAVTGTGAILLSSLAVAAAGDLRFTGAAAIALAQLALAATGTAAAFVSGSAAIALQPYSASAAGAYTPQAISGSAALALSQYAASAAGAETFSGAAAVALSALALDADGELVFEGSAAVALAALALAGAGAETFTGAGALSVSSYALAAAGALGFTGAGALALSRLAVAALGGETFTGDAALALARLAVAASGTYTGIPVTGTGAIALAPYDVDATGPGFGFTGDGAIGLAPYGVAGAGLEVFSGAGSVALSKLAVAGLGFETFTGTGAIALRSFAVGALGSVVITVTGSGSIALSQLAVAASAAQRFEGTIAIVLSPFGVASSAEQRFEASGAIMLAPFALEAAGDYATLGITGEAAIGLASFGVAGGGSLGFTGTGAIGLRPFGLNGAGYRINSALPAVPGEAVILTRLAAMAAPIQVITAQAGQLSRTGGIVQVKIVRGDALVLTAGRGIVKPSR